MPSGQCLFAVVTLAVLVVASCLGSRAVRHIDAAHVRSMRRCRRLVCVRRTQEIPYLLTAVESAERESSARNLRPTRERDQGIEYAQLQSWKACIHGTLRDPVLQPRSLNTSVASLTGYEHTQKCVISASWLCLHAGGLPRILSKCASSLSKTPRAFFTLLDWHVLRTPQ